MLQEHVNVCFSSLKMSQTLLQKEESPVSPVFTGSVTKSFTVKQEVISCLRGYLGNHTPTPPAADGDHLLCQGSSAS